MASEGVELGYPGWRLDCAVPGSGGSRPTIQLPSSSYDPTRRSKRQRVERVAVKREPEDHCTDAEPRTSGTTATTAAAATPAPYGADAAVSQAAPADAPFAWEWKLGHGRWARYNTEIEAKIEKLYQARSTGRLDVNGSMYTIDTARLRQTNNDTGYHRDLRRKSLLASSAAPSTQDGSPRARAVGQADDASGVVPSGAVRPVGDDAAATTAPDNLAMVALGSKQVDAAEKRVAAAKLQERRALQLLEDARKKIKVEEKQLYLSKQLLKNACITAGTAYPASLSPVTGGSTTARPSSGAAHSLGDHAADLASMSLSAATRTEAPKDVASFRASSATVVAGERGRGGSSGRPSASSSSSSSSEEDSSCSSDDDDDDDGDNGASSISSAAATASPPVAIATYGRRGAPVFTKPGSNIAASRADRRRSSSPQSAAGMATSRSDTCQSAAGGKRGHGGHSLPGFGQAATTLTDRVHRRKPRRLVLHYNSGLGSDAPATRGALPTGLVATCALDGSIVFSALYAGVPALGRSGLRLCSAGTLTTETLLGTSGTSKHTPEDLGFGPDYLLAVYRGISPQAAGGTSARRQQAVPQVAVIDARKLVKGQKGGRGGAPKLSSSPIRAYCLKETPVSGNEKPICSRKSRLKDITAHPHGLVLFWQHAQGAGPSAVATLPLPAGSSGAADESASRRSFVTGGVDHAVHLWIMKGKCSPHRAAPRVSRLIGHEF